jgi:hypothetical protein
VTDNLSGINYVSAIFYRNGEPSSQTSPSATFDYLVSGTERDGIFQGVTGVSQYSLEGRYYLTELYIYDNIGNKCYWRLTFPPQEEPDCAPLGEQPYFIYGADTGPLATATPTPTPTPTETPTATPDLIATQTAISNQIETAVAATLTAIASEPTRTPGIPLGANQLSLPSIIR